ncbi:alpha/beta hydrolase [Leifsonia sp. NPDC056665]|uniref:alpha/beta hydrolase n=1 Tax=Leifsonia sp. NPDC056665 TaxID=3345901 RepID=UPI003692A860
MRSEHRDWSPLAFASDPTPGNVDAVAAWMGELGARAERDRQRGHAMDEVLGLVDAGAWSGLAADAFRDRLRVVRDGARAASTRQGEAGTAAKSWAEAMFATQFDADRALRAAEEAERDIAMAQAAVGALTGDHAALLDGLAALERSSSGPELYAARERAEQAHEDLVSARRRLEDAEQRLEDARALGRRAAEDYGRAEREFAHRLEAGKTGALEHAGAAELKDFTSGVGALSRIDVTGVASSSASMSLLRRLSAEELKALLAGSPALLQRFWDSPPDPQAVAGWWNGLTPETRAALLPAAPALFGNLPGIPYADRDTANRIGLAEARKNPDLTDEQRAVLKRMDAALNPPAKGVPVQLVAFNFFTNPPMVAVGYGDLDSCDNTTWCASGMYSGAKDSLDGWAKAAKNLWRAQKDVGVVRPGVVACLEYDNPDAAGVGFSESAKKGAVRFAAELDGNTATRAVFGPGPAPITVTAHSYGTTMASIALTLTCTRVDAFVMVASAGIDTTLVPSLSKLHADHIYTTAATADLLAPFGANLFGRAEPNPTVARPLNPTVGGAQAFSSDGDGKDLERVDGHNAIGEKGHTSNSGLLTLNTVTSEGHGYYDRDTQSLYNIAATTTGRPSKVSGGLTDTTEASERHNSTREAHRPQR